MFFEAMDAHANQGTKPISREEAFTEILNDCLNIQSEMLNELVAAHYARTSSDTHNHDMLLGRLIRRNFEKFFASNYPQEWICTGPEHLEELRAKDQAEFDQAHRDNKRDWNNDRSVA